MSIEHANGAYETSLSRLSDHDWAILSSRASKGWDWNVHKLGRKWIIGGEAFANWPLYPTKTAAYDAFSAIICAEARHRAAHRTGG